MIHKFYRNLKIQGKFTIAVLFAVLIPYALLAGAFSGKLYDMIVSDTIRNAQESAQITTPLVEEVIGNLTTTTQLISTNTYYESIFYSGAGDDLSTLAASSKATEFKDLVDDLETMGFKIRIFMSLPENSSFYNASSSKNIFVPVAKAKGTYWYGIFQSKRISNLFCPSAYLGPSEIENYGDCAYITYMTMYANGEIYPCYLAIYYHSDVYKNILADHMTFEGEVSYIINEREEIVATTDEGLSSTYRLRYSDIKDSLMSSNSFIEQNVLGRKVYVAFHTVAKPGWFIVTVIPEAPIFEQVKEIITQFVLIIILCVAFALLVGLLQSKSITNRISRVIHQMDEVRNGPPIPMPESVSEDEVGELIKTYNYMATEMQQLIIAEQKAAEHLRIAEFNALQAQINPHFLYNTMDMINWMAKDGRTSEVSEVVQRLSRFYKLTLSRKNTINSIADEIEHVSIYVELQNMRHGNPIDFVVDMPDELTNFSIPKLTLQPIIENAIVHGILEKEDKQGTIIITGWEEDDDIILLVSDDGVGIPEDKMGDVLSEIPVSKSKGSNVAISNIHQRLKILCGEEYGLSYSSTVGEGTEVTIRIPKLIG